MRGSDFGKNWLQIGVKAQESAKTGKYLQNDIATINYL